MSNIFQRFKNIREFTAKTLEKTLEEVLSQSTPVTEVNFRDIWLNKLREDSELFPDGWYDPPPHGLIVMFATPNDISRLNEKSYREKQCWPRDDVFLDAQKSILLLHSSPVDWETGASGDFGVTLYFGKDETLQNHLKTCLSINRQIAAYIHEGQTFSEIVEFAQKLVAQNHLISDLSSPSDPTGTNIGHVLPITSPSWNESKFIKAREDGQQAVNELIRQQRIFLNTKEQTQLRKSMGITIEPRPWKENLPPGYFHSVLLLHQNGEKEYIEGFDSLFKLVVMDYMLH